MSKIISEQVEKTRALVSGLRSQINLVHNKGIDSEFINQLDADNKQLAMLDAELDKRRDIIYAKTRETNQKLVSVKNRVQSTKKMIKRNFSQEKWIDFGIADKR